MIRRLRFFCALREAGVIMAAGLCMAMYGVADAAPKAKSAKPVVQQPAAPASPVDPCQVSAVAQIVCGNTAREKQASETNYPWMDLMYALSSEYIRIATAFDAGKMPLAEAQGQFAKAQSDFRVVEAQRLQAAKAQAADQQARQQADAMASAVAQQQAEEQAKRAAWVGFFQGLQNAGRSFSGQ
jgi:hypothetical protein